jgi:hypothetical protein
MAVPYTFASATSAIPLSQLDNNFATPVTIGNVAIQLGNTVSAIGNVTLNSATLNNSTAANVTITSVSTPITAAQGGTGLASSGTSGNVLTSNGTVWSSTAPTTPTSIANGTSNVSISSSGGAITMATAGTTAITVDTGQRTKFPTTIGVGNTTPATSGAGISFPATQSNSSDANTLDDYEEGTWTPSLGGNTTYTYQVGTYTKVGRLVTAIASLQINVLGTGSTTTVSGLPFNQSNANGPANIYVGYFSGLAVNVIHIAGYLQTASAYFVSTASATATVTNQPAIFGNGTNIEFTVVYLTA